MEARLPQCCVLLLRAGCFFSAAANLSGSSTLLAWKLVCASRGRHLRGLSC